MKAHAEEIRKQVLDFLRQHRSQQEISIRTGIPERTIEDWAVEWRKEGTLVGYKRAGMEFTNRAKQMSNGYYKMYSETIHSMRWTDKLENRTFGFNNPTEAIHYYLKDGRSSPLRLLWENPRARQGVGVGPNRFFTRPRTRESCSLL